MLLCWAQQLAHVAVLGTATCPCCCAGIGRAGIGRARIEPELTVPGLAVPELTVPELTVLGFVAPNLIITTRNRDTDSITVRMETLVLIISRVVYPKRT
jgi:hypothetical protein